MSANLFRCRTSGRLLRAFPTVHGRTIGGVWLSGRSDGCPGRIDRRDAEPVELARMGAGAVAIVRRYQVRA